MYTLDSLFYKLSSICVIICEHTHTHTRIEPLQFQMAKLQNVAGSILLIPFIHICEAEEMETARERVVSSKRVNHSLEYCK